MTTPVLFCAACGAPMRPDEARPGSEEMVEGLRFHARLESCTRIVLARYWERRAERNKSMTKPCTCPECGDALVLYANGDNGPADDRWTCDACGVEYPHTQFPLPAGYVRQARAIDKADELAQRQADERWRLARWNEWAVRKDTPAVPIVAQEPVQQA